MGDQKQIPVVPEDIKLNLDKVSGGVLEWGLCEFNDMYAEKCPVGSYAITKGNWWYQCMAKDKGHETNYWHCSAFKEEPTVIYARPRNSNE